MFDPRREDEHVSRAQREVAFQRSEDNLSLEDVYRDRSCSAVSWHLRARRDCYDSKPERSFLHECACGTPTLGEEYRIYHPLLAGQMLNQNFTLDGAVHG